MANPSLVPARRYGGHGSFQARALLLAAPRLRPRLRELFGLVAGSASPVLSDRHRRQMFDALTTAIEAGAAEAIAHALAHGG